MPLLEWARAAFVVLATYLGLAGLHFGPTWGISALALAAGALTLASVDLGILAAILALSLPLLSVSPVSGILFIALGLVGLRYLGSSDGAPFLIIAASIVGAFFGPAWAVAAMAGYMLGAARGSLIAAIGCLAVQATGIALGRAEVGVIATGGAAPLVDVSRVPENLFALSWIGPAFRTLDAESVRVFYDTLSGVSSPGALLAQPLLWAAAAAVAGALGSSIRSAGRRSLAPLSVVAGVAVPAFGSVMLRPFLALPGNAESVAMAFATSAAVALAAAYLWDGLFPVVVPPPVTTTTMNSEDADVDELLRLIATAEDKVANQYTTVKTVMITDMKSFSKMTEEDGSAVTAKAVQRHRDLLLPIIERHKGHGKSTGGDGLIAAFDDAATAVTSAVEMQQVLAEHTRTHPHEREMTVRIGIAYGEVVLDRGGRPFIGAALNIAARIMNLADGGQAFTTATVVGRAGLKIPTHSHGTFELKNIDKPVEVIELLWHQGQVPIDPRQRIKA
jgi:class 3 adenylate cyclase